MGGKKTSKLQNALRKIKAIRTWQLFLILLPLGFLVATLLRFDHLQMSQLRAEVLAADELNDTEALEEKLTELQQYVFSHTVINIVESNGVQELVFGTGPFYLEYSYRRAANAAIKAAEATLTDNSNPNGNIYAIVENICRPLAIQNGWQWYDQGYLDCWTTELAKFPSSDTLSSNAIVASVPSTELYRLSYASPIWAPTVTGWVMVVFVILAVIVLVRSIIWVILKLALVLLDK